jgi:uncharacterized protein involved in exopolysaccharide biosynthesis/Mrp family chromosome partitioning ATPase
MRADIHAGGRSGAIHGEINLGAIGRTVWQKKLWIIGPTILMAAAAFVVVNWLTPRYKSEARVLVEGRENIFLRPEADKAIIDRGTVDQETVTSQVQLVLSRDLARQVIAELHLSDLPEFNAALREPSPLAVLREIGLLRDPMAMTVEERVLAAYYDRLSAYAVDKSRVIVIDFQSADPELAARAANLIAEKYLVLQQVAKQDQARLAGRWLSGELETLRRKVSEAEARVEEFRARANLFVGANNTALSNQQLTELNSQVSAARAQKADSEARARLIRDAIRAGQPLESSDIVNSELIRRLSEQRVILRAQLAEQSSTLLAQHPRIKELRAQIADLDQQIRGEAERLARSLENDAKVAGARLESLSASLDQLKRQTASSSDQDVQLRALEREAKAQRDLFESYLAKYREATARDSIAAAPADARIISRAAVSNVPYFPKKVPIVLITALATFCLCSAGVATGALLRHETHGAARWPSDAGSVQAEYGAAPARSPDARTRASDLLPAKANLPLLAATVAQQPAGLSIDELAQYFRLSGHAGRRIIVIGAARNVGTTLTAITLARLLSRAGRVVLVDLALAAPNLDIISSEPAAAGIADLVRGTASFENIISRDQFSRLHLVTAGRIEGEADDLLASTTLTSAIDALARSYDHLVIDGGVQSDMSIRLAAMAPRAVLVSGDATAEAVQALSDRLRSQGFIDVTVLSSPVPQLDYAATRSAAA